MTYLVLARKWRPRSFDTLVGQDHVVRALTHALDTQRLHHAWLFTGTRGVGKTTLSRILAKSLNCEKGITAHPCGECRACTEIDAGRYVDYVELDAASNRGVDEMTQLLEQAVYAPSSARFKVYMIDEVHMLTGHAFNAMLKTLEEPPPHVKFILATTDPQKIPVTVLSRCLQFNLKHMTVDAIVEHLQLVLSAEGLSFEAPALRLLGQAAGGSMRDALSLTDQAIAYSAGNLTLDAVQGMLGTIDQRHLIRLVQALLAGRAADVLGVADELAARGLSYAGALADLAVLLSHIAIQQRVPGALPAGDPWAAEVDALAAAMHPDLVHLYYSIAVHSRGELALAPDEYAGFVMACLRMLSLTPPSGQPQPGSGQQPAQAGEPSSHAPESAAGPTERAAHTTEPAAQTAETAARSTELVVHTAESVERPADTAPRPAESLPRPIEAASHITATAQQGAQAPSYSAAHPAAEAPVPVDDGPDVPAWEDLPAADGLDVNGEEDLPVSSRHPVEQTPADAGSTAAAEQTPPEADITAIPKEAPLELSNPATSDYAALDAWGGAAADDDLPSAYDSAARDDYFDLSAEAFDDVPAEVAGDGEWEPVLGEPGFDAAPLAALPRAESSAAKSKPRLARMNAQEWPALAASLPLTGLAAELARQSEWVGVEGDCITLRVAIRSLAARKGQARLRTVLTEHFGKVVNLAIQFGQTGSDTAHAVEQERRAERQKEAEAAVADDPFVRSLIEEFGARVMPGTIAALDDEKVA